MSSLKAHGSKVGEQAREENSSENAGNQHCSCHHASRDLILRVCLWTWCIHHCQRAQITGAVAHDYCKNPVNVVVVDVNGKITRDSQWMVVTEKEERDEGSTENDWPYKESGWRLWKNNKWPVSAQRHLSTHPFHPRCSQAAKHRKNVERKEARDGCEEMCGNNSEKLFACVRLLNFRVNSRENRQRHEKDEENVKKLHEWFLEDLPVRRTCVDVDAWTTCFFLLLLAHHLVISIEFVQGHSKVCVKAEKDDEHCRDEVINRCFAHWRPDGTGKDADDCCKSSTDVRAQHDSSSVLWRKLCCHSISRVLENSTGHVENNNWSHCCPEESAWPCWRVNHCQDDGDEKDDNFYDQTPNDTFREITTVEYKKVIWGLMVLTFSHLPHVQLTRD